MKKRIAMIITAVMMACVGMYAPISAQVVEDVNQTTEAEEQKEAQQETETKEAKKEDEKSEPNKEDALSPNGNMTLVDNVTADSGKTQFLTLTSRDGNFYYLIIDHDKDGNENVHFLNQVDERDLMGLMEDKEAKQVEEDLEAQEAAAAEKALQNQTQTNAVKTDSDKTPVAKENTKKKTVAVIGMVILLAAGAAGFFVLKKKKDAEPEKEDPDADFNEDLGDEFNIEPEFLGDEDFDDVDDD